MNKEESLALYEKRREAWNAWAAERLAGGDEWPAAGDYLGKTFLIMIFLPCRLTWTHPLRA